MIGKIWQNKLFNQRGDTIWNLCHVLPPIASDSGFFGQMSFNMTGTQIICRAKETETKGPDTQGPELNGENSP